MAIFSPPQRPTGPSEAEALVFDALRDLPDDCYVLHSLWLNNHNRKAHAEIDFVIIGRRSVLLLEVKGGRVSRDQYGWHFHTKAGQHVATRPQGPFDQVRSAYYATRDHLEHCGRGDLFRSLVWGYGVLLPECLLSTSGHDPGIPDDLYLDMSGFPAGLNQFLERLSDYWTDRSLELLYAHHHSESDLLRPIPPNVRREVYSLLRPDFEVVRGRGADSLAAEIQICTLTSEQLDRLDMMASNRHILLEGAAGTGKTILATEQAIRQAISGKHVLFTCFNRLLADDVRARTSDIEGLDVSNYHQLLMGLLHRAGLGGSVPDDWDSFNEQVEDLVMQALDVLGDSFSPYDYLVMDEAQDLMTGPFLDALGFLLREGLENGPWTLCLDRAQTIFVANFDAQALTKMESLGATGSLSINCRNTREVAANVTGLTGLGSASTRTAHGPDVGISYYGNPHEFLTVVRRETNRIVQEFIDVGIPPEQVVLLASDSAALADRFRERGCFLRPVTPVSEPRAGHIRMGTVQSFKGMEASAVVLLGTSDIRSDAGRRLVYVGGSRAKTVLQLILPADSDAAVQENLPRILSLLRDASAR